MPDYRSRLKNIVRKEKANLPQTTIPVNAALVRTLGEYAKADNYRLNFKYYNHRNCELNTLRSFKPLIEKFNYMTQCNFANFRSRGRVYDNGDYHNLFYNLPKDVDLEEMEIVDPGRIIFFRVENYICLVSVLTNHRRT